MSGGSTLATLAQQVAMAFAVAAAALLLELTGASGATNAGSAGSAVHGTSMREYWLPLWCSAAGALLTLVWYRRLPTDAGAQLSGHKSD
jgi:hypothetical protein